MGRCPAFAVPYSVFTCHGQPEAITAEELIKRIQADKNLNIVNLKEGGYVSKDKFDAKETELTGIKTQLADANKEIQSAS